jgi:hypothetical protein
MTVFAEHEMSIKDGRYCPGCGHLADDGRYCPVCGQMLASPSSPSTEDTRPTARTMELRRARSPRPPERPADVAERAGTEVRRSRVLPVAVGSVLSLAVIAGAGAVLLSRHGRASGDPAQIAYRQQLGSALTPLVSANNTLSRNLQALQGTDTKAAQTAVSQAQQSLVAAGGAVAVLSVPTGSQMLSQQTQQALAQENGYLQSVSATLSNPTGNSSAGLQALGSSTSSAFVPLSAVAPGGSVSLSGTASLVTWAQARSAAQGRQDAAAQQKALKQAVAAGSHTTTVVATAPPPGPPPSFSTAYLTPSGAPLPGDWVPGVSAMYAGGVGTPYRWSGGQSCDQNIFAGTHTSCAFADSIFQVVAGAIHYDALIPSSITAYSPATGTTYSLTCTEYSGTDSQNDLQCVSGDGAGAAFPVWAATAYYG